MALTRKFLSALGIEADKVDEIISAHTETVDALKEQRDQYKADAERLPEVQKELDAMKATKEGGDPFEQKYNDLKAEYDQYKADQAVRETTAKKEQAYKELLREAGISEKRFDAVLKLTDLDAVEIGEDGKVKDSEKLIEGIKTEWAGIIPTVTQQGANTPTPPSNTGGSKYQNKDEIMAIRDTAERQRAIAENHEMFGF